MSEAVKRPRRRYHSPLRADQAGRTRRRILDAGLRLFVERGYAGTTIAEVAADVHHPHRVARGGPDHSLGGKRGLLEGVVELAIAGQDDPPTKESEWWEEVADLPDAGARLEKMVEYSCTILARTRPVHVVIRGASDKEAFAAELAKRLLHERLANQTARIREYLGSDLVPGLSVVEAGQRYCALASPELYHMLTVEFGWKPPRHRKWLTELLARELLDARPASH